MGDEATEHPKLHALSVIETKYEMRLRHGRPRPPAREGGGLRAQRRTLSPADFENLGVLGRGAFAEVTLARKRDTGVVYAIKRMSKADLVRRGHVERAWTEWMVQSEHEKNEWLVRLHFCFQTAEHVYLVMDYVPGGDLMGLLMRLDVFPERQARYYAAQTVQAIAMLHRLGYAHRDLKPDNLLIDAEGHIKLADLGLAKVTATRLRGVATAAAACASGASPEEGEGEGEGDDGADRAATTAAHGSPPAHPLGGPARAPEHGTPSKSRAELRSLMFSRVGTPDYMAPEVLTQSGYGPECDWWSLGCILFEMLVGYAPFWAESSQETAEKILRHTETLHFPREAALSAEARDLISRLLRKREERLGVEGIMAHPFFSGVDFGRLREAPPPFTPRVASETDTQNFEEFVPAPPARPAAAAAAVDVTDGTAVGGWAAAGVSLAHVGRARDESAVLFAGFGVRAT